MKLSHRINISKASKSGLTDKQRFFALVVMGPNNCWAWIGSHPGFGHGNFRLGSRIDNSARVVRAHRFSWEMKNGPIPKGLNVLHHCDNPRCVNPDHLFLGTLADNNKDKMNKGRHVALSGEQNPFAKLTWKIVREIRSLHTPGRYGLYTTSKLARKYGIGRTHIQQIVRRELWKEHESDATSHN